MFRCTIDSDHFSDPNVDVSTVVSGQYVLRPVKADVITEVRGANTIRKRQALLHILPYEEFSSKKRSNQISFFFWEAPLGTCGQSIYNGRRKRNAEQHK